MPDTQTLDAGPLIVRRDLAPGQKDARPAGLTGAPADPTVIEPDHRGHRLRYVATVLRESLDAGQSPRLVLGARALDSPEYRTFLVATGLSELVPIEHVAPGRSIADMVRSCGADRRVLLLDGDRYLLRLVLCGVRRPLTLLLMRSAGSGIRGTLAAALKALLSLVVIGRGGRVLRLSGRRDGRDGSVLLRWLPAALDPPPLVSREDTDVLAGIRRPYFLVAGRLDERKSVVELLRWSRDTQLDRPPALVLAGRLETAMQAEAVSLASQTDRAQVIDKFLSDEELAALYAHCAAVVCLYRNEGPSGAVAYARRYGKPVLSWGNAQVAAQADEAGLLLPVAGTEVAHIDAACRLLDRFDRSPDGPVRYSTSRSDGSFAKQVLAQRKTGFGLP